MKTPFFAFDSQNRPCISARSLYELLSPEKPYDAWFGDMCSFGLKEGHDYSTVSYKKRGSAEILITV